MGNLMKNGVSYTGSMLGGSTKTFKGILEAGKTSISFVDTLITGNSTIDYETSKLGVNPIDIEVANNAVTLTFAAQAEDIGIKVTISNDAAEPAPTPTKMRFLKATGVQKITLPVYVDEGLEIDFYANFSSAHLEEAAVYDDSTWAPDGYILHTYASDNELCGQWRPGEHTFRIPKDRICHFHITDTQLICNETVLTKSNISVNHYPLHLFSRHDNASFIYASFSRMKIYKLSNLVMDLLPTKVGGEACYYDLVGKKAYFSETSTPFQLEEIDYEPTPCISVGGSQQILHLPMTFTTGNENYVLKSKMYFSSDHATTANEYTYFASAWNGRSNMIGSDNGPGYISVYPTGGRNAITINNIKDRWVDVEINQAQNYFKIDGVIYNNTWVSGSSQFYIQGGNTGASTPVFYGETQIYQNGTLIANYIPSVKANGIGYFYDTISQTDKISEGSSSFGYACF